MIKLLAGLQEGLTNLLCLGSLPAAGILAAAVAFGGRAADGRGSRCDHRQRNPPGQPRGTERVPGVGEILGHLFH